MSSTALESRSDILANLAVSTCQYAAATGHAVQWRMPLRITES